MARLHPPRRSPSLRAGPSLRRSLRGDYLGQTMRTDNRMCFNACIRQCLIYAYLHFTVSDVFWARTHVLSFKSCPLVQGFKPPPSKHVTLTSNMGPKISTRDDDFCIYFNLKPGAQW